MDMDHSRPERPDGPPSPRVDLDFVHVIGSLHALLLSTLDGDKLLTEVATLAAGVVEPQASCGITVRHDGQPFTVASSDALAAQLDEAQYAHLRGPCLEAMTTGTVVEIRDQSTDQRWDGYRQHAVALGVRSSLSTPLLADGLSVGALNLYSFDRPDAFQEPARRRAEIFSSQAATAFTLALRYRALNDRATQLEQALVSRSVIDQAIGALMVQQQCDAPTAFAMLRQHSQNQNQKLREVAARVVTRATGHDPMSPPPFTSAGEAVHPTDVRMDTEPPQG